jgi:hypothetical protein
MRIFRPAAGVLLLVLGLALTLGTSAGFAASAPAARQGAAARGNLLDPLWAFLVSLWSPAGCEMDPWGRCLQGARAAVPHTPTADAGCEIDPLGRCIQGARTAVPRPPAPEAGCEWDPLGRCITQP